MIVFYYGFIYTPIYIYNFQIVFWSFNFVLSSKYFMHSYNTYTHFFPFLPIPQLFRTTPPREWSPGAEQQLDWSTRFSGTAVPGRRGRLVCLNTSQRKVFLIFNYSLLFIKSGSTVMLYWIRNITLYHSQLTLTLPDLNN